MPLKEPWQNLPVTPANGYYVSTDKWLKGRSAIKKGQPLRQNCFYVEFTSTKISSCKALGEINYKNIWREIWLGGHGVDETMVAPRCGKTWMARMRGRDQRNGQLRWFQKMLELLPGNYPFPGGAVLDVNLPVPGTYHRSSKNWTYDLHIFQ